MIDFDNYIVWACLAALLVCVAAAIRLISRKRATGSQARFVMETLNHAREQGVNFDIKIPAAAGHSGISGKLLSMSVDSLKIEVPGPLPDGCKRKEAEVYFRVMQDREPVFFVFESEVLNAQPETGTLELAAPGHLRVEKKRHFNRIQPPPSDIKMLAVWQAVPGRRLPRENSDLGPPATSWKQGQIARIVQLDNIAGSGLALKFTPEKEGPFPLNLVKGRQLICLLVFTPDKMNPKPVIFWCMGEIMNVRQSGDSVAVGMEFINWAVQQQGETEIHWTHNSPWRGVKPILQWVQRLEQPHN